MRLFVANIDYEAEETDLNSLFLEKGFFPAEVRIVRDRQTGSSRGFGFVKLGEDGQAAIQALNGVKFLGRALVVREASEEPRTPQKIQRREREHARR
jgi:cold-inducible RNA-binding protein